MKVYLLRPPSSYSKFLECWSYAKNQYGETVYRCSELPKNLVAGDVVLCYDFTELADTMEDIKNELERLMSAGITIVQIRTKTTATKEFCDMFSVIAMLEKRVARIKHREALGCQDDWGGQYNEYSEWTTDGKATKSRGVSMANNRAVWQENAPPSRWIDEKILAGWTTDKIVREFNCIGRLMPDIWRVFKGKKGSVSKHYVNMRRLHLTR